MSLHLPCARRLFAPVDAASLVFFRLCFGLLMAWEMYRFLGEGKVDAYYIEPTFYFKYLGFEWVRPWRGAWMYAHFYALLALALCVAAGLFYRLSTLLFALGYTYVFLLDQAQYQNHYYLICLLSFLLVLVPAHCHLSLDARFSPRRRSGFAPAWALWLLRAQMGLVYFFAGLAKLNGDWLRGWPLRQWLPDTLYLPLVSPLLDTPAAALFCSYAGLLVDLLAFPLLLWPRTRRAMLAALLFFHLANSQLFGIGVFPYLGAALTLLFLPADWPRRLFRWPRLAEPAPRYRPSRWLLGLLAAYLAAQLALPLRHFFYPGNVSWTEEGHRFAWHMKLRDKECRAAFVARDPHSGARWRVEPRAYLTPRQRDKMLSRPYMIVQFARHVAARQRRPGGPPLQVFAHITCSLNSRPYFPLVDAAVDMAQARYGLGAARWILPLPPSRPGEIYQ